MGNDELIATAGGKTDHFNHITELHSLLDNFQYTGYAGVGHHGVRTANWRPESDWAADVLAASNLKSPWHGYSSWRQGTHAPQMKHKMETRSCIGRLAAVCRYTYTTLAPGQDGVDAAVQFIQANPDFLPHPPAAAALAL